MINKVNTAPEAAQGFAVTSFPKGLWDITDLGGGPAGIHQIKKEKGVGHLHIGLQPEKADAEAENA